IDDIFARRAELEEGVDLPEGFDEIWRQSVSAHATASYNLATAKEKLLQQEGDLAALGDAGPWPIMSARMEELMTELGDYRSKLNGLPNRERDIETANSRLADLARQLGSSDVQTVVASTPSAPAIARVRTLVGEWNRLDEALKSGREEVAKAERAVRRLE
ncbi:hypothetical protein N4Q63_26280, partial [Leclercia adecarboxylata]|uniref:hypothetical protein n=1 Tax=Leclercia adecarboxylata TaxID=83655 RepID=UPI00234C8649|nr:hypothetical protein [Leclercia adecarboxylata]